MKAKKILIATDLSEHGTNTLRYAASKVLEADDEVLVLSVVMPYLFVETLDIPPIELEKRLIDVTKTRLSEIVNKELGKFKVEQKVIVALQPAQEIVEEAKRAKADVILLGSHGAGAAVNLFIGSTAQRVIKLADTPVLVVPVKLLEGKS